MLQAVTCHLVSRLSVVQVLLGPSVRTIQRWRTDYFNFGLGLTDAHFDHLADLLAAYKCRKVPCIVAEDASAAQPRLEAFLEQGTVKVVGMNGPVVEVWPLTVFKELQQQAGLRRQAGCMRNLPSYLPSSMSW